MLDRTVAPPFSNSGSLLLPPIEEFKTAAGLDVFCFNQVKQSLVKIDVIFKAGKWYETLPGISHFTAQMLEKGTISKNSSQIASVFDLYGAHIEISPGFDYTSVSLYSLTNKLKEVLPLFLEIIQSPSFESTELDLMKAIFAQNLKVNNEKNSQVASKQIRKNLFGEHHPYGSSIEEKHLADITSVQLSNYFRKHFTPFQIYITGQIDKSLHEFLFSSLDTLNTSFVEDQTSARTIVIGAKDDYLEKQGSIQTSIRLGKRTINRGHEDYFDLLLLNHILGGYFGSRLMKNIREEKGLTYGIYSSLNTFVNDSFFVIGADVNKENQQITIDEIKNELKKLQEEPISEQELTTAKSHFIGSIQLDMANPFAVIEKAKSIRLNRLHPDYYTALVERIRKISSSNLMEVSQKYLRDQELSIVRVG